MATLPSAANPKLWGTAYNEYLNVDHAADGTHADINSTDLITKSPWADVRAFGAVGDGITNDYIAIQAAIDSIKTIGNGHLYFPIGVYRVETTLDCTGFLGANGITNRGIHIGGASMNGSRILGATTGTPIFDFTNSTYSSMYNLRITGHTSNTPNIAILLARNTTLASAGFHNFRRIFVEGEFTKGGIYSFASEENHYDNVRITISGGGATWCMALSNTNFESITSAYETILTTGSPMTRTTFIAPQFKMSDNPANGTCLYIYGDVRDLDCYGAFMYSEAQSHIKMYAPDTSNTPFRISFHNLRAEGDVGTTKPDYGLFMTGASDGSFAEIMVDNSFIQAFIYEIYQDNTVSESFSGVIDRLRSINGQVLKFNKVTNSQINVLTGDLTVDTAIVKSEIVNYSSGTISLAGEDAVVTIDLTNRLFKTDLLRKAESILPLDNTGTPSVSTGNLFITSGTTTITDFDDGVTGQVITTIAEHTLIITDGTNIFLNGSANFSMTATDTLTLIQKADGKWYELSRGDNGA